MTELQSSASSFFSSFSGAAAGAACDHIVDQLIAERGHTLVRSPLWPLMRPFLYGVLHYHEARRMADAVAEMTADETFQHISSLLDLNVSARGLGNIPKSGAVIVASNHPTGIADGVAMFDLLSAHRPDMVFFANRDAVRVNTRLAQRIIPVEWRASEKSHAKSRETLVRTNRAFADGKAVVMF
nr:acyltransferase [Rhizobiaceae bacterium]